MFLCILCHQVMFIQNKGHVTLTIELLDTEEAQADDPLDVQVEHMFTNCLNTCFSDRQLGMNNLTEVKLKHSRFLPQCLSSYMEQFVGTESSLCSQAEGYFFKPVFLPRYDSLIIFKSDF